MLSRLGRRRLCIGLATCLFLAFVFAATAAIVAHGVLHNRARDYCDRCLAYASAIADTIPMWAAPDETPDVQPLARFAAMAGLLYVRVMSGGEVLLETTAFPAAEAVLAEDESFALSHAGLRQIDGRQFADVVVRYYAPLPRTGEVHAGRYGAGTVRVGIDASALSWAATNTRALGAGLGALAWVISSALTFFLLRSPHRAAKAELAAPPPVASGARVMPAGSLTLFVDEARLAAAGTSIRLTPKQLDLLKVLMSEPGRTFSDEEILAQAWPGSSYADSRDVKQYVYLVRQRLNGAGLSGDKVLVNVPGIGYRVDPAALAPVEPLVDSCTIEPRPDDGPACRAS
jgi:DNA-binding winged helix-turn-helix (wHTH) protein